MIQNDEGHGRLTANVQREAGVRLPGPGWVGDQAPAPYPVVRGMGSEPVPAAQGERAIAGPADIARHVARWHRSVAAEPPHRNVPRVEPGRFAGQH